MTDEIVYVLAVHDYDKYVFKIGFTTNPIKERILNLQTGNHKELVPILCCYIKEDWDICTIFENESKGRFLEKILLSYGKKIEGNGGKEWRHLENKDLEKIYIEMRDYGDVKYNEDWFYINNILIDYNLSKTCKFIKKHSDNTKCKNYPLKGKQFCRHHYE